jgi:hypothetical protein
MDPADDKLKKKKEGACTLVIRFIAMRDHEG